MVHGNAHDDRSCGSVPAQTPTMSAHIMEVKHTRPGLAIQAVGEPWESLAEHGLQQRAITAAAAPTSDRSPRAVQRLQ